MSAFWRFPTVEALAAADLMRSRRGQGLGLRSRARLHAAARIVRDTLGGEPPRACRRCAPCLESEYIAAAIASTAFGLPEPALDSNVIRVITRVFNVAEDPQRAPRRTLRAHARALPRPTDRRSATRPS